MTDDENIYLKIKEEFDNKDLREGLWVKSLTLSQGDKEKAKYKYIEFRVEEEKDKEKDKEKKAQAFKENISLYGRHVINALYVQKYLIGDEEYIKILNGIGITHENILQFLYRDGKARGIYNKAATNGCKEGLIALSKSIPSIDFSKQLYGSPSFNQKHSKKKKNDINQSNDEPKKNRTEEIGYIKEIDSSTPKQSDIKKRIEKVSQKNIQDHWSRKTLLIIYPVMFLFGFIEVLSEGVKEPVKFTFNAIFDGGITTIAFIMFIFSGIWTLILNSQE